MPSSPRPDRVLPDEPTRRPLERFWPYAELSEEPSEDELAALDPELRDVLFGAKPRPFSITIVFPRFEDPRYEEAIACAKAADEYVVTGEGPALRHRARFFPADRPLRLRNLYEKVGHLSEADVLVDDRPVPYARQLWLPLVWMLIR